MNSGRFWTLLLDLFYQSKLVSTSFILFLAFTLTACNPEPEIGSSDLDSLSISISSGDGQFKAINSTFDTPLTVQITGSQVVDVPINFSIVDGSASGTLGSEVVMTDANGNASTTLSSGGDSGTISVKAKIASSSTEISTTFNVFVNGSAVTWDVSINEGTTVGAGDPLNLHIEAHLAAGTADPDFNGSKILTFSSTHVDSPNGTAITLPADGAYTFTAGVIDADLAMNMYNSDDTGSETYTVSVSGSGLSTGTTAATTVTDAAINSIKILDADACTGNEIGTVSYATSSPQMMYVYYYDAYENCIEGTSATADWSKTFSDPQATFTGGTVGTHSIQFDPIIASTTGTVSVNDAGRIDSTGTITIVDGTPDHFLILGLNTEGNFAANVGTSYNLIVEARDAVGNPAQTYDGAYNLTWTTTGTDLVPPTALGLGTQAMTPPTSTTYNFTDGVLISPTPTVTFTNASETPTLTVYDGASCGASLCGTSGGITLTAQSLAHALIRTSPSNLGGDAATFDATAATRTADDTYTFYCAGYDTIGNYLGDYSTADWLVSGNIAAGDVSPGLTDQSTVTFTARVAGNPTPNAIQCDLDGTVDGAGIADTTENFNMLPGTPVQFQIDGGSGDGAAFTETAGTTFSVTVNAYDADGNLCTNFTNGSYATTVSYSGSTAVFPAAPAEITPTYTSPQINGTSTTSTTVNLNISGGTATIPNNLLINDTENSDEPRYVVVDNSAAIATGTSGIITVNQNSLASLSIRDTASNGGNTVSGLTITADATQSLFAAGYDNSGNYLTDQNADWSNTAPSGNCAIGELTAVPGPITSSPQVDFAPTQVGSCTITAEVGAITDNTGAITLNNGAVSSFEVVIFGGGSVTAGTAFAVQVTALDADGNRVTDYTPDTTYTLTTSAGNSPEGTAPSGWALAAGDFVLGRAVVSNVYVYDASSTFTMTATETGSGSTTGTSSPVTIVPNTLHHYAITGTGGGTVADRTTNFSVTVEARDEWGNATSTGVGANVNISTVQVSDEALVGTVGGGTGLAFSGTSQTYSTLTYGVSHQVQIVATDTNSVTTPVANRMNITFTAAGGTVQDYVVGGFSTTTPSAGDAFTATITARDEAGNTITGLDGTLGGYTFTASSGASTSYYSNAPSHHSGTVSFTNGVSNNISFTFYAEETVSGATISVNDGLARTGTATGTDITVAEDPLNNYEITTSSTIPATALSTFEANIQSRDQWGNNVAGDASINLGVNQITGGSVGTLSGTTTAINMTTGQAIINNLTYDVVGQMELTVSGGSVTAPASRSVDYDFTANISAVNYYELTFTSPANVDSTFNVTVTAKDSGGNTITDAGISTTLSGRTMTWGGVNNSPHSNAPTLPSPLSFTAGVATATFTFTEATTIASGSLTINDGAGVTGSSTGALVVNSGAGHHFHVAATGFPGTADGNANTSTNLVITLHDQYGNTTTDAAMTAVDLTFNQTAGYTNTGTMSATLTDGGGVTDITTTIKPNFNASSTQTVYDVAYNVAHSVEVIATKGAVTTASADTDDITFTATKATVNNYLLTFDSGSATAGASTNLSLTARDAANNVMTSDDTVLDTISFTFAVTANVDAPDASEDASTYVPAAGVKTFTSGVATLPFTFFHATNGVAASDVTVTDTDNAIPTNNTTTLTVNPGASNYFTVSQTGFAADADGSAQTGTQVDVTLNDDYGNATTDGAITAAALTFSRVSGVTTTGTLQAATTDGGGLSAVTGITLDFSGASTQSLYDFSYDVSHVIEIIATSGGVTTSSANSADLTWSVIPGTVASYDFALSSGNGTTGVSFSATLTAKDAAGNVIDNNDTQLDLINFTFSSPASLDAPDASATATDPTGPTLTFSSGVATINWTVFNDGVIATNTLTVNDTTNSITNIQNNNTKTIDPAAGNYFVITQNNMGSANADGTVQGTTDFTITLRDDWGNDTTDASITNITLSVSRLSGYTNVGTFTGALTDGGGQLDISLLQPDFNLAASQTIYDVSYNVSHQFEIIATKGGVTTATGDTPDITMNFTTGTVSSYTLALDSGTQTAGTPTTATISAFDAASNLLDDAAHQATLDTITFSHSATSNVDAPNGTQTASVPATAASLGFASGAATLTYTFYKADNPNGVALNDITATDTTNTINVNNNNTMIITASTPNYITTTGATTGVADNATTYAVTVTSNDTYGNAVATGVGGDAALSITPTRLSGAVNTGTLGGTTTVNLRDNASQTVNVTYQVPHTTRLDVSGGSIGMDTSRSTNILWTVSTATVASYTLEPVLSTVNAGTATNVTFTALDGGSNIIVGEDTTLNSITYTFTTSANLDAPDGGDLASNNDPTSISFTNGVDTLSYTFFNNANGLQAGDIRIDDTTNTLFGTNVNTMTVNYIASDRFLITNSGFGTPDADTTAQTSTSATITLVDTYGNPRPDSGVNSTAITFARVSGYTNTGVLQAATTDGGGLVGSGTLSLDFTSASAITIYDFAYDVGHTIELFANDGGISTVSGDSADMPFQSTANTVASYTLSFDNATRVAGVATTATLSAFDAQGNLMDDASDDAVLDAILLTFTFPTPGNVDAPNATATASKPTDGAKNWTSGTYSVAYTFYNAVTNVGTGDVAITDNITGTATVNASNTMTITPAAHAKFKVTVAAGFAPNEDADAVVKASTQLTVVAYDTYDNPKDDDATLTGTAAVSRVSGFTNTGNLTGAITDGGAQGAIGSLALNFNNNSTVQIYDLSYDVGHVAEVIVTGGGQTTATGDSADLTWNVTANTVQSYTLDLDSNGGNVTAGATTTATLTALDGGNNVITGNDATLDTIAYTYSAHADLDGPTSGTGSVASGGSYSSGTKQIDVIAYNTTNNIANNRVTVNDTTNSISGVTNDDTALTITAAALAKFTVAVGAGFAPNENADATAKTSTQIDVTALDTYGNGKDNDATLTGSIAINRISGFTNTGTMNGTLTDGGGTADITGLTLDFNNASSDTIYDLSYDVGHVVEIIVTGGGQTTATGDSADLTWVVTTGTVQSYTLDLDSNGGNVTAGATTTATLTALDGGGNTITGNDATLDTITYTYSAHADLNGPSSGTGSVVSGGSYSSGTKQIDVIAYNTTNNIANNRITVNDTTNSISGVTNDDTALTITAAALARYSVAVAAGFAPNETADGAAKTSTQLTVTALDTYGNGKDNDAALTASIALSRVSGFTNTGTMNGTLTDGGGTSAVTGLTLDFNNAATDTIYDLSYDVGHVVELIVTGGGQTTATGDSADLTWIVSAGTVASYTLDLDSNGGNVTAGATTTATLTAYDAASNVITGNDATLDGITFTYSAHADLDGPTSGTGSVASGGSFSSGTKQIDVIAYNTTNNIANNRITVNDTTNSILGVTNDDTALTITAAALAKYTVAVGAGFAPNEDADATTKTSTQLNVTALDTYGNGKDNDAALTASIAISRVSGFTNTGTMNGTLTDGGGTADITGLTLDFNNASSDVIYDLSYDVGHVVEVIVTGGGQTTATGDSADLTWNVTANTVQSYTLDLDSNGGNVTAGATTTATLTALDGGGNTITGNDATLDTITYTYSAHADLDGPTSGTGSVASGGSYSSGTKQIDVIAYNTTNNIANNRVTVNDTTNSISGVTNDDTALTITAAALAKFTVAVGAGFAPNENADATAKTSTQIDVTALDTYGNGKDNDATLTGSIAINRISGFTNTGTMNGTLTDGGGTADITGLTLDFNNASSDTIYDLSYDVGHVVEIIVTGGGQTTATGDSADLTWVVTTGTVQSYTLDLDSNGGSVTAGATTTATLTALDGGGNTITGNDATLDTITYTYSAHADLNGPSSGTGSVASGGSYSSGTKQIDVIAYNTTNDIANNRITVNDTTNSISGVTNDDTALTITAAALARYSVAVAAGFAPNENADGAAKTSTQLTVTALDTYGNGKDNDAALTASIALSRISGFTNTGTMNGTLTDGGGTSDVTGLTLDFNNASTDTIYDLSYNVGHVIELIVTGGGQTTATGDSADLTWVVSTGTVASYTLDLDSNGGNVTAGATTTATLTAYDAASNVITGNDATLDTITFTYSAHADLNGPTSGTGSVASGGSFSSGTKQIDVIAYNTTNNIANNRITVNDTTNSILGVTNDDTALTITAAALARYTVAVGAGFAPNENADAAAKTSTQLNVTALDTYGNGKDNDASLTASVAISRVSGFTNTGTMNGTLTDGGGTSDVTGLTLDFNNASSDIIYDLSYDVGHVVEVIVTGGGQTTATGDSADLTWVVTTGTVQSYTLDLDSNGGNVTAGATTTATLTALDGGGNTITGNDATLDTISYTYSAHADLDGPTSGTGSVASGGSYSSGTKQIDVIAYNTTNNIANNRITVNDTTNSISGVTNDDTALTITAAALAKYTVAIGAGFAPNENADATAKTSTQLNVTALDTYGNGKDNDAALTASVAISRVSGFTNTGTMNGTLTDGGGTSDVTGLTLDFNNASSDTIYDLSYDVGHVVEVIVTGGGQTTATGDSADLTWVVTTGTVQSYTLDLDNNGGSETAGATTTATLTALDGGGNTITGNDATLDTITYTYSAHADLNGPSSGTASVASGGSYSSGTKQIDVVAYNTANNIANNRITVNDTTNSISGVTNDDTALTVTAAALARYSVAVAAGFAPNENADGAAKTSTQLTVTALDTYGNGKDNDAALTASIALSRLSGFTNTGTMNGTLTDGGGTSDVTGLTLDFNNAATDTIYDLSYNVGHVVELIVTGGGQTTATGDSADLTWVVSTGTVASYTLDLDSNGGNVTAGATTTATLTAYDAASNVITGNDATLDTIAFTYSAHADLNGPTSGTGSVASGGSFSSGTKQIDVIAYNTTNDIANNRITVNDTTNSILGVTNDDTALTIDAAALAKFTVAVGAGFAPNENADGATKTSTQLNVTALDTYGNGKDNDAGLTGSIAISRVSGFTNTGTMNGTLTDGGGTADITGLTLDFNNASSDIIYDLSYDVGHVAEVIVTGGGQTTATGDSADLTWVVTTATVASYTLDLDSNGGNVTAGATTTATLTALDAGGNTITGNDATLDTISFTYSAHADLDGPTSGTGSVASGGSFSSGTKQIDVIAYNTTNNIANNRITVNDTTNSILGVTNDDTALTITAAALAKFTVAIGAGFGPSENADATAKTSTQLNVTALDTYGNGKDNDAALTASVAISRVSGFTNTGTMNGTLTDGGGTSDVTGLTLDFNNASSDSIYDLSYDVGHVVEVIVTGGGQTTATGDSADMTWAVTNNTVQSYTLTMDEATKTAGVATTATLTALDGGGNTITGYDGILDTISYTYGADADLNAPDSSATASVGSGGSYSSGTKSIAVTVYNAVNNVAANKVTVNDTTNSITNIQNSDTMTVTADVGDRMAYVNGDGQTATVDTQVATDPRVKIEDTYGNPVSGYTVNFAVTDALTLSGSVGAASDTTDANGEATVTYTLGQTAGTNTMRASATGLTGTPTLYDFTETGSPDTAGKKFVYTTQPVANETTNKAFATQPVLELRDQFENVFTSDSSTVVTLTAYLGAGCSAGAAGTLSNNTDTAASGIFSFSTLQHSAGETISIQATSGGVTAACSNTTAVAEALSIDNTPGSNQNTGDTYRFEVTGGVLPLTFSLSANNSGASIGAAYTGGGCTAGKVCADYTAGMQGNGVTDTVQVDDSATVTNTDTGNVTVDGASFSNTGNSPAYGSTASDLSRIFTVNNGGNAASGSITMTFTPDDADCWDHPGGSDFCAGTDLATSGTCNVTVTFTPTDPGCPSGSYSATLDAEGASGGKLTLGLTATKP